MRATIAFVVPMVIALCAAPAQAQQSSSNTPLTVKIGVLSDMSGLYADIGGPGSVAAAQMAVEDFNPESHHMKVEIVSADHQNKPDIGSAIARRWFDTEKVNAIADVPNSGVALAVSNVTREKNGVFLVSGAADSDLTDKQCSPNSVHWTYDTWALAHGTGGAIVQQGGKSWFFITADYAFGHALERDTAAVVKANGGKVLGKVRAPINNNDFSSFLLQAQTSKAKIIGLANAGGDTINSIKQASEFGIMKGGQKLAALLFFAGDVAALGLPTAQGLTFTETFYWDLNDKTRAWTKQWAELRADKTKWPTMNNAGTYAGTLHYLKARAALGGNPDGKTVVAKMKEMTTDDVLFGQGYIRADGRKIHPAYLFEVKKPEESKYPGDFYHLRATIPAEEAFRPLKDGGCPLVSG